MRLQPTPRYPDEGFYFDPATQYELVVHQDLLQGQPYPQVETFHGRSIVTTSERGDGTLATADVTDFHKPLWAGERLVGFQVGDGTTVPDFAETDSRHTYRPGGQITHTYQVAEGDRLIVRREDNSSSVDGLVLLATEPLPQGEDAYARYTPQGIITAAGVLVSWGREATYHRRVVDLAVATALAHDALTLFLLDQELGQESAVGLVRSTPAVKVYLEDFDNRHGTSYTPTRDAYQRLGRQPVLREDQLARYGFR